MSSTATQRRVLLELGTATCGHASNSQLGAALGIHPDVVGRYTRALAETGLIVAGRRGAAGIQWSLTDAGREQRARLLTEAGAR